MVTVRRPVRLRFPEADQRRDGDDVGVDRK
jgi:hypothetical protein